MESSQWAGKNGSFHYSSKNNGGNWQRLDWNHLLALKHRQVQLWRQYIIYYFTLLKKSSYLENLSSRSLNRIAANYPQEKWILVQSAEKKQLEAEKPKWEVETQHDSMFTSLRQRDRSTVLSCGSMFYSCTIPHFLNACKERFIRSNLTMTPVMLIHWHKTFSRCWWGFVFSNFSHSRLRSITAGYNSKLAACSAGCSPVCFTGSI